MGEIPCYMHLFPPDETLPSRQQKLQVKEAVENTNSLAVCIFHAPPPDGEDASATFAERATEIIKETAAGETVEVDVRTLTAPKEEQEAFTFWKVRNGDDGTGYKQKCTATNNAKKLAMFLISCSADGSVERSVRKIMRKLSKKQEDDDNNEDDMSTKAYYAVALLGHARCENSANQMSDTIFGTGRRFEKALESSSEFSSSSSTAGPCTSRLETQVELRGPEEEFDPWVKDLLLRLNVLLSTS